MGVVLACNFFVVLQKTKQRHGFDKVVSCVKLGGISRVWWKGIIKCFVRDVVKNLMLHRLHDWYPISVVNHSVVFYIFADARVER